MTVLEIYLEILTNVFEILYPPLDLKWVKFDNFSQHFTEKVFWIVEKLVFFFWVVDVLALK